MVRLTESHGRAERRFRQSHVPGKMRRRKLANEGMSNPIAIGWSRHFDERNGLLNE